MYFGFGTARLVSKAMILSWLLCTSTTEGFTQEMNQQQATLKLNGMLKEVDADLNCFIIYYENRLLKFYADRILCVRITSMINEKIVIRYEYRTESDPSHLPPPRTYLFAVDVIRSR
jgi:hypothetical protein